MKIKIRKILLTALFVVGMLIESSAIIRVNYIKRGGGLFGFKNVSSTYQGTVSGDDLWRVNCSGG